MDLTGDGERWSGTAMARRAPRAGKGALGAAGGRAPGGSAAAIPAAPDRPLALLERVMNFRLQLPPQRHATSRGAAGRHSDIDRTDWKHEHERAYTRKSP